ncbi:formate dehydrogenase accessory protein FdhE [Orbaceae bacterium ESL0727]|nr:formate dehydrogenase accessory protein FdhE [Orbaceae bacterium ESL0727]
MSIKILPQTELEQQSNKKSAGHVVRTIPLLFYPAPNVLYAHRLERLQALAKESPFADYLQFCASIVAEQLELLKQDPIHVDLTKALTADTDLPPLSLANYPLNHDWQRYLEKLLASLPKMTDEIAKLIEELQKNSPEQYQEKALRLLNGEFDKVSSNESLFIWAALSLYYTQLASQIKGKAFAENSDKSWLCPVCNSLPVASTIHIGQNLGLRYLHCSLCESEWYVPRVKCTSCDNLQDIHYFSLDDERAATQAECCDHCHSYLKIFNQELAPHLDVIADDIATLMLDMKTEEEGFAKSGLNPFLFAQKLA